jgi:hypothetical protein
MLPWIVDGRARFAQRIEAFLFDPCVLASHRLNDHACSILEDLAGWLKTSELLSFVGFRGCAFVASIFVERS